MHICFSSGEKQHINFYVTPLDSSSTLVLRYHWLNQYNPSIDWVHNRITFRTNTLNEPPTVQLPKNTAMAKPELAPPKVRPADQTKPGVTPRVTLINAKVFKHESMMQGSQCFRLQVATYSCNLEASFMGSSHSELCLNNGNFPLTATHVKRSFISQRFLSWSHWWTRLRLAMAGSPPAPNGTQFLAPTPL